MENNSRFRYANVITTIAVALCLILWSRLDNIDSRLRIVEQQTAAIAAKLEVKEVGSYYLDKIPQQGGFNAGGLVVVGVLCIAAYSMYDRYRPRT